MPKTSQFPRKTKGLASLYPTGYNEGMMTKFAILFSLVNERSTVHVADCRSVKAAQSTRSHGVTFVDAGTAKEAAAQYDARIAEQGLRKATICKCAT